MGVLKEEKKRSRPPILAGLSGGMMLLLGVLALLIVGLLFNIIPSFRTTVVKRDQPPVLQRLAKLNKFTAATGTFQVVVDQERKVDGLPSVLVGERTVLLASGDVDAQVDFTGLKGESIVVSSDGKEVTVRVPPPQITPARIDNDKTYVVSRSRGIFTRINDAIADNPVDDQPLYADAAKQLETAANKSSLLTTARDNTNDMLKAMLTSLGFQKVTVVFDDTAPAQAPDPAVEVTTAPAATPTSAPSTTKVPVTAAPPTIVATPVTNPAG